MSDEPYEHDLRFLIALDVLTDERRQQAFAALASLESQNQALQERIETAARYVGKMNHTLSREGWHTSQHCARCDLEPLLSPTQETDPE